jgi:NADPH2:quinone reductase
VLVTGASGGVGSIAIDLLSNAGYEVAALSRKPDVSAYLQELGATTIVETDGIADERKPLEAARWAGAIDTVGGDVLAWLTRTVIPWGSIASIGLVGGIQLHTTVMPFILRGISILGVTSANCPMMRRTSTWGRLVTNLKPRHLERIVAGEVSLETLPTVFDAILSGRHCGRYLVNLR